jgi:hypothetical protein
MKPSFLITIDTEGDNAWARPRTETTRNSAFLARFQTLAEKYGFKPVWLTTWEMAECPVYREFAQDVEARGTGEIGMHLHAWNSPPEEPLTEDDLHHQPFLIEYSVPTMREKVLRLTERLRSRFRGPIVSHRAGRWGFDHRYAKILVEAGYQVDCSVTPNISWRETLGNPAGKGGADFRHCPETAYYLDLEDISRPGSSTLLEVPMTTRPARPTVLGRLGHALAPLAGKFGQRAANKLAPRYRWLRPDGSNLADTLALVDEIAAAPTSPLPYAEWMLHSSEFMPGGSPRFPDTRSIERLFEHTEQLFSHAANRYRGLTLAEYAAQFAALSA